MAQKDQQGPQLVGEQPAQHLDLVGGVNWSTPPYLLKKNEWHMAVNMHMHRGYLKQEPPRVVVQTVGSEPILNIVSMPTGHTDYAAWIVLTATTLYLIKANGSVSAIRSNFVDASTPWATCAYDGKLFLTNDNNVIAWSDGSTVFDLGVGKHTLTIDSTVDPLLYGNQLGGPDYRYGPFQNNFLFTYSGANVTFNDPGQWLSWTTGQLYRVYLQNPSCFNETDWIQLRRTYPLSGTSTTILLLGKIVQVNQLYCLVQATGTSGASGTLYVDNREKQAPWAASLLFASQVPRGRYLQAFYDHLVVGAPPQERNVVQWSDLNDFTRWKPNTDCEADKYYCSEFERTDDLVRGVTGLHLLEDRGIVLTAGALYEMAYVGLPRVMRVMPINDTIGFGNGLPWASAALADKIIFLDVHHATFLAWSPGMHFGPYKALQDVGSPIAKYFFQNVNTATAAMIQTRAFINRHEQEIWWLYCKGTSTTLNAALIYKYSSNSWTTHEFTDGVCTLGHFHKRAATVEELSGTCGALTGTCGDLEQTADAATAVFGTTNSELLRISTTNDADGALVTSSAPYFETGDLIYGDVTKVKEVRTIYIQAEGTFDGIQVEVSGRQNIGSAVVYTVVGVWTPSLANKRLTFKAVTGNILRYRFTFTGTVIRSAVFYGYTDNILEAGAFR